MTFGSNEIEQKGRVAVANSVTSAEIKEMEIVLNKRMRYMLYKDKDNYLLSVVCGTVAIFETNIYLTREEIAEFEKAGEAFIDALAEKIKNSPDSFTDRQRCIWDEE